MAGIKLTNRVQALEAMTRGRHLGAATWVLAHTGETVKQAIARHEAAHGPVGSWAFLWSNISKEDVCA